MGLVKAVIGTVISIVAFVLAIKLIAILLGLVGIVFWLLKMAIIFGLLALIVWVVVRLVSPRRAGPDPA
jgi:hypothetical protein